MHLRTANNSLSVYLFSLYICTLFTDEPIFFYVILKSDYVVDGKISSFVVTLNGYCYTCTTLENNRIFGVARQLLAK